RSSSTTGAAWGLRPPKVVRRGRRCVLSAGASPAGARRSTQGLARRCMENCVDLVRRVDAAPGPCARWSRSWGESGAAGASERLPTVVLNSGCVGRRSHAFPLGCPYACRPPLEQIVRSETLAAAAGQRLTASWLRWDTRTFACLCAGYLGHKSSDATGR